MNLCPVISVCGPSCTYIITTHLVIQCSVKCRGTVTVAQTPSQLIAHKLSPHGLNPSEATQRLKHEQEVPSHRLRGKRPSHSCRSSRGRSTWSKQRSLSRGREDLNFSTAHRSSQQLLPSRTATQLLLWCLPWQPCVNVRCSFGATTNQQCKYTNWVYGWSVFGWYKETTLNLSSDLFVYSFFILLRLWQSSNFVAVRAVFL